MDLFAAPLSHFYLAQWLACNRASVRTHRILQELIVSVSAYEINATWCEYEIECDRNVKLVGGLEELLRVATTCDLPKFSVTFLLGAFEPMSEFLDVM